MSAAMGHQRALELIPWLVNGTLDEDERAALERHVHDCLPCRAELRQQRALAALVAEGRNAHLSPQAGFDALMRRADERGPTPFSRHLAVAASIGIVVLGIAALLVYLPDDPVEPSFSTLADGGGGTRLDIVFTADVSEAQLRELVRGIGGTIVAGPSDVGRYTIELAAPEPSQEALDRLLERLRGDARIRFAGRSFMPAETRR